MPEHETIVASGTPSGESAVAAIRLSGPLCPQLAKACLSRGKTPPPRRASRGNYISLDGELLDDVLWVYFPKPRSYTGEDMLEIWCHGNPLITQKILEDLLARGCRAAQPGEFTRTAFTNGKLDLSQAEAVADLIEARSDRALKAARQQLSGVLGDTIRSLSDRLLAVLATIEAYIDFPEEDLPPENAAGPLRDLASLTVEIDALIRTSHYKALLHEGIRTLIVGEPNAGKSSLLNALLGEERAIVSETPGTTRDYLAESLMAGPYRLRLIDTAGLHEASDELDRMGVEQTLRRLEEADFFLVVADSSRPAPEFPEHVLRHFQPGNCLVIENKIDLPGSQPLTSLLPECPRLRLSLKTGAGLEQIHPCLIGALEHGHIVPDEDAVLVSARHARALENARTLIDQSLAKLRAGEFTELCAVDLRGALDALGEVIGKIDNEAMLDKLFAHFCIGK